MTPGGRPLRFIGLMVGLWIAGRAAWLWPAGAWADRPEPDAPALAMEAFAGQSFPRDGVLAGAVRPLPAESPVQAAPAAMRHAHDGGYHSLDAGGAQDAAPSAPPVGFGRQIASSLALMGLGPLSFVDAAAPSQAMVAGEPQPAPRGTNRLSGSAWLFGRSAMAPPSLATGGQLGGSQFGARLVYRVAGTPDQPLSAFARIAGPLSQRGRELAFGAEAQPFARVPVRLAIERRIALEEGAASGMAVSAIGGGSVALPHGLRLDAYGQAGVIGLRRRDLFVDGAAVVTRQVARVRSVPVRVGAGLWGGAQPGVSRLDVGPRVEAGVPFAGRVVRLGLDWREKVAGNASPGSGPAVTVGADF